MSSHARFTVRPLSLLLAVLLASGCAKNAAPTVAKEDAGDAQPTRDQSATAGRQFAAKDELSRSADAERQLGQLDDGRTRADRTEPPAAPPVPVSVAEIAQAPTVSTSEAPVMAEATEADAMRSPAAATISDPSSGAKLLYQAQGRVALAVPQPAEPASVNTENYASSTPNPIKQVASEPVSTFSIDVDTGAFSNTRRMLVQGALPPSDAVRAEEFINYFDYGYRAPSSRKTPFSITTEMAPAPWNKQRQLLLVGLQGYEVPKSEIPAANLVFLLDVSGSMAAPNRLPLVKQSLEMLVGQLSARDRVSIVVYAGAAGAVLEPTPGDQKGKILEALQRLEAGGSTNGGDGIELAYAFAERSLIKGGVNRIILATDGDFNVGTVGVDQLKDFVASKRDSGVSLSTLGYGDDNYNDEMAEQLADVGNGNHAYIDTLREARKVLVDEISSTLFTIAKDVKIQLEFNPSVVSEYRLIGYENRMLRREDFNNDAIDAGEIGAGHTVTALYELALVGSEGASVDPLRYGEKTISAAKNQSSELGFLKLRYKLPSSDTSTLVQQAIPRRAESSDRLRFATAVAGFAEKLRGGTYLNGFAYQDLAALASSAKGRDEQGHRAELLEMIERAGQLHGEAIGTQVSIAE